MNCPTASDWDLLALEVLEGEQAETLWAHARTCLACRRQFDEARRAHVAWVRMYETFDRDHDALREQLLAALPNESPKHRGADGIVRLWYRLGDYGMTLNRTAGRRAAALLVPAACVLIAVGFFLIPGQRSAFAAALERLQRAKTIVCRTTTTGLQVGLFSIAGSGKLYLSAEYGGRVDVYANGVHVTTNYTLPSGARIAVQPLARLYVRLGASAVGQGGIGDFDPDRWLRELQKLSADAVRELGRDTIDGQEVTGFEISGQQLGLAPTGARNAGDYRGELWVAVKTSLPVRYVVQMPAPGGESGALVISTYDQFEWDTPLDPGLFQPDIPADYTLIDAPPPLTGEPALLRGLEQFVKATGRYPRQLDMMTVVSELLTGAEEPSGAGAKERGEQARAQAALEIGAGCAYYMQLVREGRQPEYFGDEVTPADADKVLLRWQLDGGQVRVVYGDLHGETLPSEK